jgi:TRAP-type transport system periplasmic protein
MPRRLIACIALSFLAASIHADPAIILKFASQAPENTPIGAGMAKLGAEIKRLSGGGVVFRVYGNGSQGDEEGMRQKMDTGLLDGALFDTFGLTHLSPEAMSLSAPALIADQAELDRVMVDAIPFMRDKISAKGYHVAAFATIGWVRFFSRYDISTPDDLKKYKIAVNPYEKELMQLYKLAGLSIVLAPMTTVLQQLQSRSVDVFYTTPTYMSYQWSSFKDVGSKMVGLKVCPVIGGIIISNRAWAKIPDEIKSDFDAACDGVAAEISKEFTEKETVVIEGLKKYGLSEIPISEAQLGAWRTEFAKAVEKGTGTVYTREMLDLIRAAIAEHRRAKK